MMESFESLSPEQFDTLTYNQCVTLPWKPTNGVTYHVYASPWGGSPADVDYTTPIATSSTLPVRLHGLRGSQQNGTRYLVVRQKDNGSGIEDQGEKVVPFVIVNGEWVGNLPDAPTNFAATLAAEDVALLTWRYDSARVPDEFKIYANGSYLMSVPAKRLNHVKVPFNNTKAFKVTAFLRGKESLPSNTVSLTASAPVEIASVTGATTWRGDE